MNHYTRRLKRFVNLSVREVPLQKRAKSLSPSEHQRIESAAILKSTELKNVVLLDKRGKTMTSEQLSKFIETIMEQGDATVLIGGPYGFTEAALRKAHSVISLSALTFPHQLVRLIFVEQLYRAFTIARGEKYHHP